MATVIRTVSVLTIFRCFSKLMGINNKKIPLNLHHSINRSKRPKIHPKATRILAKNQHREQIDRKRTKNVPNKKKMIKHKITIIVFNLE